MYTSFSVHNSNSPPSPSCMGGGGQVCNIFILYLRCILHTHTPPLPPLSAEQFRNQQHLSSNNFTTMGASNCRELGKCFIFLADGFTGKSRLSFLSLWNQQ